MRWVDSPETDITNNLPDLNPLVNRILNRRGFIDQRDIRAFLDPNSYTPHSGGEIPGLTVAADRIESAIERKESICVWGDFDADGQTATTVLVQTLQAMDVDVTYHIPIRATESHGVNIPNLGKIIDNGGKLIVTCDTGITAHEPVDYAQSRGVDFVITDHHDLPETLPKAAAVTNPKLLPIGHPLGNLAGVGVAYKLAEELLGRHKYELRNETLLDLVAIGLVADLAVLQKDTRYLVQKGLEQLKSTQRLGLNTMMEISELSRESLTEEHIGFVLGPRLNALGRLGDANPAVELLTTTDPVRARVLATQLEGLNIQRKLACDQVFHAAESQLMDDPSLLEKPAIILSHPNWPGGVIGITASKLVDRYRKPAILFSTPANEPARGSARSIEGINITEAISAQKDILLGFGGHPMAAGLSLNVDKLPEFRHRLYKTIEKMIFEQEVREESLFIDGWVQLHEANLELSDALEKLAPFGPGNEKPVLAVHDIKIIDKVEIGKNKEHLKLVIQDPQEQQQEVLWWDGGGEDIPIGKIDMAFSLRASDWRGVRKSQLEMIEFRRLEDNPVELKSYKPEIIDFRRIDNKHMQLKNLPLETLVWVEGPDKVTLNETDRSHLRATRSLAIWTTPPTLEVFRRVLEITQPRMIYLFAVDPGMDEINGFLERLTGLIKFAINQKAGQTNVSELAVACSQSENLIRKGLDWLVIQNQVKVDFVTQDQMVISGLEKGDQNNESDYVLKEIKLLLQETAAFRQHFYRSDKGSLLP
jgi:single-stranded-DNA-specific exonuclease